MPSRTLAPHPMAIGRASKTKINANMGASPVSSSLDEEVDKLKATMMTVKPWELPLDEARDASGAARFSAAAASASSESPSSVRAPSSSVVGSSASSSRAVPASPFHAATCWAVAPEPSAAYTSMSSPVAFAGQMPTTPFALSAAASTGAPSSSGSSKAWSELFSSQKEKVPCCRGHVENALRAARAE